ncbi:hypothetical protein DRN74_03050 [Candidatus Micrarchaeota archaeon]|nr:MAG: hypothetical protein DRN74_03050 [Candidatus Micrarchaeota archaeon]
MPKKAALGKGINKIMEERKERNTDKHPARKQSKAKEKKTELGRFLEKFEKASEEEKKKIVDKWTEKLVKERKMVEIDEKTAKTIKEKGNEMLVVETSDGRKYTTRDIAKRFGVLGDATGAMFKRFKSSTSEWSRKRSRSKLEFETEDSRYLLKKSVMGEDWMGAASKIAYKKNGKLYLKLYVRPEKAREFLEKHKEIKGIEVSEGEVETALGSKAIIRLPLPPSKRALGKAYYDDVLALMRDKGTIRPMKISSKAKKKKAEISEEKKEEKEEKPRAIMLKKDYEKQVAKKVQEGKLIAITDEEYERLKEMGLSAQVDTLRGVKFVPAAIKRALDLEEEAIALEAPKKKEAEKETGEAPVVFKRIKQESKEKKEKKTKVKLGGGLGVPTEEAEKVIKILILLAGAAIVLGIITLFL